MIPQIDIGKLSIDIFDRLKKANELKSSANTIILLTLLECKINLQLIDSVKVSINDKTLHNDKDVNSIIEKLKTDYLELLVFNTNENTEVIKITQSYYQEKGKPKEITSDTINKYIKDETAFQLICNLFVKVNALKDLIHLEHKGDALKDLDFKTRLRNIKYRFIALVIQLQDNDSIRKYFGVI